MKLDLPLRDALTIYALCYATMDNAPQDVTDQLQPTITKLREQLAQHYEKDLLEIESYSQLVTANTHGITPGLVH